jgi:hypothetical protein
MAKATAADAIWWQTDLQSIFANYAGQRRQTSLEIVFVIADRLANDGAWNENPRQKSAYRMARYWIETGKWDLILVALHLSGQTATWPRVSARWGAEPFNPMGLPNTGLFSIVSLLKAAEYGRSGGPDPACPYPLRRTFLAARDWRSASMATRPSVSRLFSLNERVEN